MVAITTCHRGRGKNRQYWNDEEVEALVNVLQELACDPLWKVDGGFKNNYMGEVRKSGCQWDDVEHKINCEKEWYDDWCKTHKMQLVCGTSNSHIYANWTWYGVKIEQRD